MYLIRKSLGFSRQEFDRLPWHDQQMYVEGLMEELGIDTVVSETATDFEDAARPPVESLPEGTPVPANVGGPDPDLALTSMGFTVQRTTFAGG